MDDALKAASVIVSETYRSPAAHHNPIEAPATLAMWEEKMIVYDANQGPHIVAAALASAFGLEKKKCGLFQNL